MIQLNWFQDRQTDVPRARIVVASLLSILTYLMIAPLAALSQVSSQSASGSHPFTETQIAHDGAEGVLQARNPNCWFETSLAAMARVPRGQRMISEMITAKSPSTYEVIFPGDRKPIQIEQADLASANLRDPAQWATILEIACLKKFPNNDGAYGVGKHQPAIQTGIELLTGVPATVIRPDESSMSQIADVFSKAKADNIPMAMATKNPRETGLSTQPISPNHAYALIDFDKATNIVTLRNPHGREPNFDPGMLASLHVVHYPRGIVSMPLDTFKTYFRFIAWPSQF